MTGLDDAGLSLLAIGVEQQGVRVCLLEPVAGQQRLVGWLGLQRDGALETPQLVASACQRLGQRLGRVLWDETRQEPLLESDDPIGRPALAHVALSLSPRPPLRVWLAGVSRSLSLAALESAMLALPVQIVGRLALDRDLRPATLAAEMSQAGAEVLLVAGGFDDPASSAQQPVLALCQVLGDVLATLPAAQRPALFYAGNRYAAARAARLLSVEATDSPVTVVDNVQPATDSIQTRELVRILSYFDWRLSERLPGYSLISRWVTSPGQVASLANNFAQLTRLWLEQEGLERLHALYVTPAWRLHVLAERAREGLRLHFSAAQAPLIKLPDWPPIQLLSGRWSGGGLASQFWWDREALAPIVSAVGQVAPLAMLQVLHTDLCEWVQAGSV